VSPTYFKIEFETERMPEKGEEGDEEAKTDGVVQPIEVVTGKIEIQKVDETMICVDFSRKAGSAWLFYEKFNYIHKALADLSDAKYDA